jgi:ribulose 1,5-bisphosphate carboxylase large subunit-like protein
VKKFMPDVEFTDKLTQPIALFDGVDTQNYVIATIIVSLRPKQVGITLAQFAAVEQSTGTWIKVPEETAEVRMNHVAKVFGCYELPHWEYEIPKGVTERNYCMIIGWPKINLINVKGDLNFAMLFTAVIGNISMGGKVKLLDIWFPKDILKTLPGPQFGSDGIRKYLGVEKRPLLNNMVKPCTGHSAKVAGELIYKASAGGVDIVKDDELIADQQFNTLEDRITYGMEAIDKANEEKGEKTIYFINVTDNCPQVFENIQTVQKHGGNGMLINYLPQGLTVVKQIAEDPSVKIPIQMHMDFAGVWYEDPWSGVGSSLTLGKLPRLVGGDVCVIPCPYGKAPVVPERYFQNLIQCVYPLENIKEMMPMPSGGITPGMVEFAMRDAGPNIMIGSGGGIHSHPDGPTSGGRAFRQAIDAAMKGIPVKKYAKDHEELAKAMGMWGQKKTGK